MQILKRIKTVYDNASDKAQGELKLLLVLFCIALVINIPSLMQQNKIYFEWKQSEAVKSDWKTSAPEAQGLDGSVLAGSGPIIEKTNVLSFLIVRHDTLVYEKYFNGMNDGNYNNVYSVTKSFVSALVGIAIEQGEIGGTADTLGQYLPEYCRHADPGFGKITLENTLTMTPGFCEDTNTWLNQKDLIAATFQLPLKYKPGEKFQYANSATHLLSAILTKTTGMSTCDFAEKNLFKPLGITEKKWDADGTGLYRGYSGLYLRPRDMAKFGLLYLHGGKWNGQQIVPEAWVKVSTQKHRIFPESGTNKSDEDQPVDEEMKVNPGFEQEAGYGYQWWASRIGGYDTYTAIGYGGQYITVIPRLDMVLVLTSRPDTPAGPGWDPRLKLLEKCVFPALKDTGSK